MGVSYLSDVGNYDQTSPYNVPLGVTPASTTVTQTLTPGASGSSSSGSSQAANSGTGTQVTVAGTVQGSNGETPSGTIQTTVRPHFSIVLTCAPDKNASLTCMSMQFCDPRTGRMSTFTGQACRGSGRRWVVSAERGTAPLQDCR